MALFDNLNKTTSAGVAPGVVEYYERTLLENARPEMVYSRDAQKRVLPEHNGRTVNFRRMIPFEACTVPLQEGVTPAGQELRQASLSATVWPYGRHVEVTDELNFFQLDNLHQETAQLLADQAALSLDSICRDAVTSGLNVQYVGGKTSRAALTSSDKLTAAEVKAAVRTLKRNNCKPFPDGFYHAVIHPDAVFDLTGDEHWIDAATYQDKGMLERYELGCLYKVKFFESTNAKVFKPEMYLFGTTSTLTMTALDGANRCMTVSETIPESGQRELTGKLVYVRYTSGSGESAVTVDTPMCVERVKGSKVYFRWMPSSDVTDNWTVAKGCCLVPSGGGAEGGDVYATVIYGQNAYGDVELGGENIRVIINPPGSAGAEDPLQQRGTIAWKVKGFTSVILQDAFLVRIEHGCTA